MLGRNNAESKIIKRAASSFFRQLITLVYPERCLLCDEVLTYGSKETFCGSCAEAVPSYRAPDIPRAPTAYSGISNVYAAFRYEGNIREMVLRFKNNSKRNAGPIAAMMKDALLGGDFFETLAETDFLVPVPLHKSRLRERGYNQAELLVAALSVEFGKPMEHALKRVKKTAPMFGLSRTERHENVKGVFAVNGAFPAENLCGKNIMLVDDIYTTGATVEECARTLAESGASEINVLAFAVAVEN